MFIPAALGGRDSRALQGHLSPCSACSAEEGGAWGLCSPGLSPPHQGAALGTCLWPLGAAVPSSVGPGAHLRSLTPAAPTGVSSPVGSPACGPHSPRPTRATQKQLGRPSARKGLDMCPAPPHPLPHASPQPESARRPSLLVQETCPSLIWRSRGSPPQGASGEVESAKLLFPGGLGAPPPRCSSFLFPFSAHFSDADLALCFPASVWGAGSPSSVQRTR